jgi:hypothetical protein
MMILYHRHCDICLSNSLLAILNCDAVLPTPWAREVSLALILNVTTVTSHRVLMGEAAETEAEPAAAAAAVAESVTEAAAEAAGAAKAEAAEAA